ncbi:restin homolog [Aplysia californica]|uniref:Restin homolog n=1 Tax=Aplysia californica TaxID=6500 RepID=A0ABM0JDM8_APLCA|nr:restin homolog [Aplysia californica]
MEKGQNPSRVPRESVHEQDERLTSKHIQTLGFLQEIVNENKELKTRVIELEESLEECKDLHAFAKQSKEKIKDIQESYMARADEMNSMLAEKHRVEMMQVENEKLEIERELKEQILKMRHDIDSLNAANKDLRDTAAEDENSSEAKTKLKEVMKQMQTYKQENEELKEELEGIRSDLEIIQSKRSTDMTQVRELRAENKQLSETVQEVQQKNNELEFRLDKALSDLREKADDQEQTNLIENLRDKVRQLTLDREAGVERETQMGQDLLDLSALKDELKHANAHLQRELEKLLTEYGHLLAEYERLRKRSMKEKDNKTFKDFVSLKRELRSVRHENETLKHGGKNDGLTVLRDDPPPLPVEQPKKKNALDGKRIGAKKMLAITLNRPTATSNS